VLTGADPAKEIGVVVNGARTADEAGVAYRQLETATRRFLKRSLAYYGHITDDPAVRESVLVQRAIVDLLPQSPASRCYRIVASRLAGLGPAQGGLRLAPRGAASVEEVPQCA
jgi:MinD-like ATPase involved in chromosome partitioning or flagellar assembly